MRIIAISDTHGLHRHMPPIPDGDILIHAGDITGSSNTIDFLDINAWLGELKPRFSHILVTPGNHDFIMEMHFDYAKSILTNATLVEHNVIEIMGLIFFLSPFTPIFFDWAYNVNRGEPLRQKWNQIPDNVDVLVTHGPPHGILDTVPDIYNTSVGCEALREALDTRINPKLHVFGHIHNGYGRLEHNRTIHVNAAICTESYQPTNLPIVIDL